MNLTVKLTDLRRIVDLVSTVTPTRTTLPSLNAVLLAYDDCVLTASASDLRSFARAHCDAVGEQSGVFAINSAKLSDVLNRCSAEEVEFEVSKTTKLTCGDDEAVFVMQPIDEFKEHPEVVGNTIMLSPDDLLNALEFCSVSVADEKDGNAGCASVAFDFDDNLGLDVLSLDGRLISVCSLKYGGRENKSVRLLPPFMIPVFKNALTLNDGDIDLTFSENLTQLRGKNWSVVGPLLNLPYPDWRRIAPWLPDNGGGRLKFNRKHLYDAVQSAIPFGEAGFVRTHIQGHGDGACVVRVTGQDSRVRRVKYDGPKFDFFVNARKFAPILNSLSGDDVTLEYTEERGVGVVIHENNFTAAIMLLEKGQP